MLFRSEKMLENEPPAYNDQIATTIGGSLLGEVSFRISSSIIDNSASGCNRVFRELFGFLTCPMNGINRLITGEMRRRKQYRPAKIDEIYPISFGIASGARMLTSFDKHKHHWTPFIKGQYHYGDPFRAENQKPFDYFNLDFTLDPSSGKHFISEVNATGSLWTKPIPVSNNKKKMIWGIFQHFHYMDNDKISGDTVPPLRYSEPASIGLGFLLQQTYKNKSQIRLESYLNAVILGGAQARSEERRVGKEC